MSKENIVEIKNNRPRLYTANGVTLQPGLNKLSPVDAGLLLSHPHAVIKQERGIFKVVSGTPEMPKGSDAPAPAAKKEETPPRANAADTITLIKGAENRDAVVPFLTDDRSTVVAAAQAKIAEFDEAGAGE